MSYDQIVSFLVRINFQEIYEVLFRPQFKLRLGNMSLELWPYFTGRLKKKRVHFRFYLELSEKSFSVA